MNNTCNSLTFENCTAQSGCEWIKSCKNVSSASLWSIISFSILTFVSFLICVFGCYKGKEKVDEKEETKPDISLLPDEEQVLRINKTEPRHTLLDLVKDEGSI